MIRLFIIASVLSLVSCETEPANEESFVIEAFIYAGQSVKDINIKSTVPFEEFSRPGQPISDAGVIIDYKGQKIPLVFNPNTLRYDGPSDILIEAGSSIQIEVTTGNQKAQSSTTIPAFPKNLSATAQKIVVPPIEISRDLRDVLAALFEKARLQINWSNDSEAFHFLVIEPVDTVDSDPLFNDDIPANVGDFFDNFRLVSEPSRDSTYTVIGLSLQNYGEYHAILYRINQEYADLYADQLQDSRNLNEPPSNIDNALGIFTGVSSDTLRFEITKF